MIIANYIVSLLPYATPKFFVLSTVLGGVLISALILKRVLIGLMFILTVVRVSAFVFVAVSAQSLLIPGVKSMDFEQSALLVSYSLFLCLVYYYVNDIMMRLKKSPRRASIMVALDALCAPLMALKVGPYKRGSDHITMLPDAMKQYKLTQLEFNQKANAGENLFLQRYAQNRSEGLHKSGLKISPFGHLVLQQRITMALGDRLQFIDYLKTHPACTASPTNIKDPVFVIGLTRTGTTFLHELLGLHSAKVQSHHTWEQLSPVPLTQSEKVADMQVDRDQRYKGKKALFNKVLKPLMGERIQYVHRLEYDLSEECTVPCSMEMPWALSELPYHIFSIDSSIRMGAGDVYRYYRLYLQLLGWQKRTRDAQPTDDRTWMLKCPFHIPFIKELHNEFPDCIVVWTHRNPVECISSACSLFETVMLMYGEEESVDSAKIGQAVMHYSKVAVKAAEDAITALGDRLKIIHIRYEDTVRNSKDVVTRVYQKAGIPFTEEYSKRVDDYLHESKEKRDRMKADKAKTEGKASTSNMHEYRPEDFGLTAAGIREQFADYIKKYNL